MFPVVDEVAFCVVVVDHLQRLPVAGELPKNVVKAQGFAFFELCTGDAPLAGQFFPGVPRCRLGPEFFRDTFVDVGVVRYLVSDKYDQMARTRAPSDVRIGIGLPQSAAIRFWRVATIVGHDRAGQGFDGSKNLGLFAGHRLVQPPRFFGIFLIFLFRFGFLEDPFVVARIVFDVRHPECNIRDRRTELADHGLDFFFGFSQNRRHRAARVEQEHHVGSRSCGCGRRRRDRGGRGERENGDDQSPCPAPWRALGVAATTP